MQQPLCPPKVLISILLHGPIDSNRKSFYCNCLRLPPFLVLIVENGISASDATGTVIAVFMEIPARNSQFVTPNPAQTPQSLHRATISRASQPWKPN
jgi:hypothetical protein